MQRLPFMLVSTLALTVFAMEGCSGSDSGGGTSTGSGAAGPTGTGGATNTSSTESASSTTATGTGGATSSSASGMGGGGGCVTLTVKNYLSWCSVSVDNNAASSEATQTECLVPGTKVNLVATPLTGFELGPAPWHDTDGDKGSGELGSPPGQTTETLGTTTPDCVWVCCPFTTGMGCPTTDQCP